LLLIAAVAPFAVSAQTLAVVNEKEVERVFHLREVEYFIDTTNMLDIEEVSAPAYQNHFTRHDSYQNKDFVSGASYWIRFPVKYNAASEKEWVIEFYDQTIDLLDVYVPDASGRFRKSAMGDHLPFTQRTFEHKNFEVLVPNTDNDVHIFYFRVRSKDFADIRVAFKSIDRFIFYTLSEYFLYGTFYGMILIISLYNLLVYIAIREPKNIYYIFYILSVGLYTLSLDGIGFQYLWPNHPSWNDYAGGVTLYLVILCAIVFTRKFLSTASNSPALDRALKWTIAIRTVLFFVELIFFPQFFAYRTIEIIPLSLIFYTGIKVLYRGYRPARFFVLAYGILFFGFFIRALVYFNVIPLTTLSHYSLHISFLLEMLFLTFALGDRIRILKAVRDRAMKRIILQHEVNNRLKDQVNRELEMKVHERTLELDQKNHELEESNRKLAAQANEINQINSILDLDNWKLKNSIKEVLSERLMDKTMDYQQFRTLYPDGLACFRFLEDLKFGNGTSFTCRKCGNDKFFKGSQKFARRCTRCGYNESITAFTIFHGIKFPIEKAFYIAYLVVAGKGDYTLNNLAQILEIRLNTVWSFKSKVAARVHELTRKGKKLHSSKWEEVILDEETRHGTSFHAHKRKDFPEVRKVA
jgi:hypothetical protein